MLQPVRSFPSTAVKKSAVADDDAWNEDGGGGFGSASSGGGGGFGSSNSGGGGGFGSRGGPGGFGRGRGVTRKGEKADLCVVMLFFAIGYSHRVSKNSCRDTI